MTNEIIVALILGSAQIVGALIQCSRRGNTIADQRKSTSPGDNSENRDILKDEEA